MRGPSGEDDDRSHHAGHAAAVSHRVRTLAIVLICVFPLYLLASFPFIYGDPGPGQPKTDPSWFVPLSFVSVAALLIGGGLLVAVRRRRRHQTPGRRANEAP